MSSSLVVEYLDEVEEGHLGLAATEEMLPKLVLDRGEPALDDGVVVAVAPSAHAPGHAMRLKETLVVFAGIRTTLIGVMQEPRGRLATFQCHPQRLDNQVTVVNSTYGPPNVDRLLYCGKLPRYAFPTDVATFHVFDQGRSSRFRPIMRFAPSQGLPIALTQYAPSKQVWISSKCYTSGAIYSVMSEDRFAAWDSKRIYMECSDCGFAKTFSIGEANRSETRDCDACGGEETFGPGRYWLRPPGFAHPIDIEEVTSPDDMPKTSYATRAKLTMGTPDDAADWAPVNDRIRVLTDRQHLLVSNTGPNRDGYTYCTKCGRIESSVDHGSKLIGAHPKPYPDDDDRRLCESTSPTRHLVLGTDFITDITLFSMRVAAPLNLKPGHSPTTIALRTVSEALADAACQLLEIEPGELMAEFRPALTPAGKSGLEAEVFLYDTLPGGAGFSSQLADCGQELFQRALRLMIGCPEECDASCYRCLRSFKNKFEHSLLDRHVGVEFLAYLLTGEQPQFNAVRLGNSTALLCHDLQRQTIEGVKFELDVSVSTDKGTLMAPILATTARGERVHCRPFRSIDDRPPSRSGHRRIPCRRRQYSGDRGERTDCSRQSPDRNAQCAAKDRGVTAVIQRLMELLVTVQRKDVGWAAPPEPRTTPAAGKVLFKWTQTAVIRKREDRPEAADHSRSKARNQRCIDFLRSTGPAFSENRQSILTCDPQKRNPARSSRPMSGLKRAIQHWIDFLRSTTPPELLESSPIPSPPRPVLSNCEHNQDGFGASSKP